MYRESGWEIGSCSTDVLANTRNETKVHLEGDREKCKF